VISAVFSLICLRFLARRRHCELPDGKIRNFPIFWEKIQFIGKK
jgi:hypothetical protein